MPDDTAQDTSMEALMQKALSGDVGLMDVIRTHNLPEPDVTEWFGDYFARLKDTEFDITPLREALIARGITAELFDEFYTGLMPPPPAVVGYELCPTPPAQTNDIYDGAGQGLLASTLAGLDARIMVCEDRIEVVSSSPEVAKLVRCRLMATPFGVGWTSKPIYQQADKP